MSALAIIPDGIAHTFGPGIRGLVFKAAVGSTQDIGLEAVINLTANGGGARDLRDASKLGISGKKGARQSARSRFGHRRATCGRAVRKKLPLEIWHGHHQMSAMLADIAERQNRAAGKLLLRAHVPLLHNRGAHVGVPQANIDVRKRIARRGEDRQSLVGC